MGLDALREGIAGNAELRLRAHLRELIERIDVYPVGYQEEYDPDGEPEDVEDLAVTIEEGMAEFNPGWKPDREFRRFLLGQRHFGEICYCKWWCKNVIGIRYGGGEMHDLM